MSSYGGGGIPFPGSQPQYVNPNAYGATPQAQYGQPQMGMGMMPQSMQPTTAAADPYANAKPGTIAYAKSEGPDGIATYTPVIAQETFYQTPGMTQRDYDKAVKRWEKERRNADKRARKEDKERKRDHDRERERDRDRWDNNQDPYEITSSRGGGGGDRQRRMSTGAGLGFERARRISGGAMLRDDDLSRKLESLDMSFNSRRERRMSGGGQAYAPSVGGFRSRKNSVSEPSRDRKNSGDYGQQRPSFYPPAGAGIPGGYGGPSYGGARDPTSASAYPAYGTERTPYSTASNLPPAGDSYALTRRPAGGPSNSMYPVSGRELNRAQPFTAFEEFFLVEDLRELMQPQPPPLPAALVPHDVMAEEWDRCMQGFISLTSQALQASRSSALEPLIELVTQWNTTFFLPRGVDISIYKGNSRRSGPPMNFPSTLRSFDDSESESESSSSSSTSSSDSEDDRYFSSARREQKAAKKAERKARRKDRQRRRRARRRQRSVSIRVRAVPIN
ncbi:hypothetical protein B0J17DRAFT_193334 [Rhizoctonia solani]|nr:hypothetical protein B0J17DRAFT_193334 [Rhizoctonia solani]